MDEVAVRSVHEVQRCEGLRGERAGRGPGDAPARDQERPKSQAVEPNSGLGKAIGYRLKHWEKLTLFLRRAGAPLDNNICERALKKAILHRKNALFYKTDAGAGVGDVFMSLIHTCALNGADPFDYITQLQRHTTEVRKKPEKWLPWNYRQTIERAPPG